MDEETEEDFSRLFKAEDLISDSRIISLSANKAAFQYSDTLNPAISFTVKEFDINSQKSCSNIFVYYSQTNITKQLTRNMPGYSVYEPVFAIPNNFVKAFESSVLFLKAGQIWQIPINGGEAVQVTFLQLPIETFKFFIGFDGEPYIAFCSSVYADATISETVERDRNTAALGTSGTVFSALMVRHWDTWGAYVKRNHIFISKLEINSSGLFLFNERSVTDVMMGLEVDCPGKGAGQGGEDFSISPDGHYLAFAARKVSQYKTQKKDFAWSTDVGLYLVYLPALLQGANESFNHFELISDVNSKATNTYPVFSYDSKAIFFLSMKRPAYESDKKSLSCYEIEKKMLHSITDEIDLSFDSIEVGYDNYTVYLNAQYKAINRIFRLHLNDCFSLTSIDVMRGDDSRFSITMSNTALFYLESSVSKPFEIRMIEISHLENDIFDIFTFDLRNEVGRAAISSSELRFSREVFNPCPHFSNGDKFIPAPEQFYFAGGGGDLVHYWYFPPAERIEGQKYPLLLIIHGGPQGKRYMLVMSKYIQSTNRDPLKFVLGAITNSWSYRWNLALFASQGYGVIAVNFHGSTGFGQKFVDSIHGDWGGKPYDDCVKAVKDILTRYSYLDENRMAALGASYGGYMM